MCLPSLLYFLMSLGTCSFYPAHNQSSIVIFSLSSYLLRKLTEGHVSSLPIPSFSLARDTELRLHLDLRGLRKPLGVMESILLSSICQHEGFYEYDISQGQIISI